MRPDPGARGSGRKRGTPCTRVGSPLVSTCVPSSQRGSLTGSHRGIVPLQSHAPHSVVGSGLMWPLLRGSPLMHPGSPGKS